MPKKSNSIFVAPLDMNSGKIFSMSGRKKAAKSTCSTPPGGPTAALKTTVLTPSTAKLAGNERLKRHTLTNKSKGLPGARAEKPTPRSERQRHKHKGNAKRRGERLGWGQSWPITCIVYGKEFKYF